MNPTKFIGKLCVWLNDRLRSLAALDTILLMRKEISPSQDHEHFLLKIYDRYDPEILGIYRSAGREISEERTRARFKHRLKFYRMILGEDTVAWIWLIPTGRRFIDEAGYHFPVPEQSIWLRDGFVVPGYRGRKMFSILLDVLAGRILNAKREFWSDTQAGNRPSVRAHLNSGFRIVDSLKILRLNRLLLIRLRCPSQLSYIDGYQPGRRIVLTLKNYRHYTELHRA